jgi:hypothetical protein
MPSKPRLLRLVPLQPLGSTLVQLALERIFLFLVYNLILLNMSSIASSTASAQMLLLNNAIARAALQQLAAQEATRGGRGARHGCVVYLPREKGKNMESMYKFHSRGNMRLNKRSVIAV